MSQPKSISIKQDAKNKLWRLGNLSWKLHGSQKELYNLYYTSSNKLQVWLLSRRFGKTYALCVLALEQCIKQSNSVVKFLSPTKIQVNMNVRPLFKKILEDCPVEIRPEFSQKDYIYYFPNGSEIQLAGSESGHAEKLRGGDSSIAFIDEARDCSDLTNIVKSILLPTTLLTKGKIILASTPPADPEHEFLDFVEDAEAKGSLIKKTIYDNPMLTQEEIKEAFAEMGGEHTDECQREYFCKIIKDPKTSVIPEFTKELEAEIVKDWILPPHFDLYEGMDLGGKDLTVNLLGYYDFRNNKVVIEDEVVVDFREENVTIGTLIDQIKKKEETHFFNKLTNEQKKPYKRVSDIDYIVINEIKKISNFDMIFEPAKKDNLEAMINFLREKLKKREIIINPRCVTLIRHLRNVKWRKGEKSVFSRSVNDGHYDAVSALIYLLRVIDYKKNPFPASFGATQKDLFGNYILDKKETNKNSVNLDAFRKIFNVKEKKA
jgi:hypothetical protein